MATLNYMATLYLCTNITVLNQNGIIYHDKLPLQMFKKIKVRQDLSSYVMFNTSIFSSFFEVNLPLLF